MAGRGASSGPQPVLPPRLPGVLAAVPGPEAAVAGLVEIRHHPPDAARALFDREAGAGAAHVGAHPAGVDHHGKAARLPPIPLDCAEAIVERRLRVAVLAETPSGALARSHLARDERDLLLLALQHCAHQRSGNLDRRLGVGPFDRGVAHAGAVDPGVVNQHVDRLAGERAAKRALLPSVRDVEFMEVHVAADLAERTGALRGAGGGVHPPAAGRVLPGKLKADAATGADDCNGGHDDFRPQRFRFVAGYHFAAGAGVRAGTQNPR